MLRRRRRLLGGQNEEDPMAGSANIVDAMLVLSVGFLIFLVMSWNMQSVVFSGMSPEERQAAMQAIKEVVEIRQGQELNTTPEVVSGSGSGMVKLGMVYQDPKTGKLIMVQGA
ncbi:MAG: DUF2149 domain-containing protein [Methanobacteriaceae archaeon]|nr:DUF2149 domain-containing protein [Methanobacteriaceae archaeon]